MTTLRPARADEIAAIASLIARSGRELSTGFYTPEQSEALVAHVFGVDSQLIADGTYFVIEDAGALAACGGWSRRRTLFGADRYKQGPDPELDPTTEPARIRAFFVDPAWARRGLGRRLAEACMEAARAAGFSSMELAATLPGVPLYEACGFSSVEPFEIELPGPVRVPLVRMRREFTDPGIRDGRRDARGADASREPLAVVPDH